MTPSGEQAGSEQDFLDGPGFTAADIKPSGFFTGLNPMTPLRGIASGAMEAGSVLVHGLPSIAHALSTSDIGDVTGGTSIPEQAPEPGTKQPWEQPLSDWADKQSAAARAGAKAVIPDPRTTGSAANLVFGASKTLTEAGISLVGTGGNLPAAAASMGYISGMARYRDLKDQGVDDDTAEKLATTEGLLQGVGMVAPIGLPAKWIEAMTPVKQLLTQMATGAAANAGQGVASRYITHQILADAGYKDLADQSQALDGEAMAADLISGAFFGGAHYAGQRPELADRARQLAQSGQMDAQVRDAAKVVQTERMAAVDRAPGVPVNPESQAIHQAALEKSITDLLQDRPVDVGDEAAGATFARPAEDEAVQKPLREMMIDEFKKAGVADEAAKLDDLNDLMEQKFSGSVKPREEPIDLPKSEAEATPWDDLNDQLPEEEGEKPSPEAPAIRAYHGSKAPIEGDFDVAKNQAGDMEGVYFSSSEEGAQRWGKWHGLEEGEQSHVTPADLHLEKIAGPADKKAAIKKLGPEWTRKSLTDELKDQGFDGYHDANEIVAFKNESIRKAAGTGDIALARAKQISDTVSKQVPKMFSAAADCASKTA